MKKYYIPSIDDEVLDGAVGSTLPGSRTAAVEALEEAALRFAAFFVFVPSPPKNVQFNKLLINCS